MKDTLISHKTAVLANKKGFILEPEFGFFIFNKEGVSSYENYKLMGDFMLSFMAKEDGFIIQCTQSFMQRWFRDFHDITFSPFPNNDGGWTCNITTIKSYALLSTIYGKTYEDVIKKSLQKSFELTSKLGNR